MGEIKEKKKLKRLKTGHIWPSVVFLIFSILLANTATAVSVSLLITYFAKDRIDAVYSDALSVSRMFSAASTMEEKKNVLDYLEKNPGTTEAIFLVDESGKPFFGFGEPTYDLNKSGKLPTTNNCYFYSDRDAKYNRFLEDDEIEAEALLEAAAVAVIRDGKLHIETANLGKIIEGFQAGQKHTMFEEYFWLGMALDSRTTALMKCKISYYTEDFLLAVMIGALFTMVMILPIVFLFISLVRNIVYQRRMTRHLYTDAVTTGKSWLYFEHHADRLLRSRGKAGRTYAIVDLTMMKYQGYCTCHGVEAGKELLKRIDKRVSASLRKPECCALYGKASFALLLKGDDRAVCENRVKALIKSLQEQSRHGGIVYHAGIYFVEPMIQNGEKQVPRRKYVDVAEYYNRAGAARTSLTDENATAVAVFDQKLLEEQLWEHRVEEKMERALQREEFQVYIQPKYNPVTEQLAGAEALVRWINEEDGFISPGRFIPIFEKNGFITRLDDYMISHVAKLQAGWLEAGKNVVPVSVNVSRAHFANPDLAEHICELVDAYKLPHHLLEIELTESAFFDDKEALLNTVRKLKKLGFDVSMDDFGAGYSSLNSLKDLPLDVLKLDAEFFRGEDGEERGEIVVSQAIDLAKKLNMRIVAEGVEKKNQVEFLAAHECDMIQGFYFDKPLPAQEYEARMSGGNGRTPEAGQPESEQDEIKEGDERDVQESVCKNAPNGLEQL